MERCRAKRVTTSAVCFFSYRFEAQMDSEQIVCHHHVSVSRPQKSGGSSSAQHNLQRGETQLLLQEQETGIEVQGRWLLTLSLESKREFLQVSMATTEFCPSTVIRLPGDSIALITTVTVRRPSRPAHACRPAG